MSIDYKKFKKIGCDDKCTLLEHPDGHTIRIAHKGLSPSMQKQLDELPVHKAKGGPLSGPFSAGSTESHTRNSRPSQPSKPMPQAAYTAPKQAKNAYTEPDNNGTGEPHPDIVLKALHREAPPFGPMGAEKQHYPPCINPSCKSFGKPHPNCRCYGGAGGSAHEAGYFADGGEVGGHFCADGEKSHQEGCAYFKAGGMAGEDPSEMVDEAPAGAPPMPVPAPSPEATPNPMAASPSPEALPPPDPSVSQDTSEPVRQPSEDVQPQPDQAPPAPMTPVQQFQAKKQEHFDDIMQESKAFESDVNSGHIKAETYSDLFDKKSTLGKIGTIFGLLIGGAGSGLANQPNKLMEMMDNEIQRDLHSQETSASNRQNFLKINQQALLNQSQIQNSALERKIKARALSLSQMRFASFDKMASEVQKLPPGSPQRVQKEQVLGVLYQKMNDENSSAAAQAAGAAALSHMMGQGGNGSAPNTTFMKSGLAGTELKQVGTDMEEKMFPGLPGMASRPIPQANRDELTAMSVLDNKAADILAFAKAHKGTLSPSQRAIGEQKAAEMVNYYNNSIKGGNLTEGRLKWLDGQVGKNPTSIFQDILGNNSRLQEIKNSNANRRDILAKSLGFQGGPKSQSGGQAPMQTATKSGVQYKKVNGGWVPVK